MEDSMVSMNINKELITPIVEQQIKQAIVNTMIDPKEYMLELISIALNEKCDIKGNTNCSNWDKKYTYIDVIINNAIRNAAKEAFNEYMVKHQKTFKAAFLKFIKQNNNTDRLFNTLLDFLNNTLAKNNYKMNVNFERFYEE